jgi:hypothetical protein
MPETATPEAAAKMTPASTEMTTATSATAAAYLRRKTFGGVFGSSDPARTAQGQCLSVLKRGAHQEESSRGKKDKRPFHHLSLSVTDDTLSPSPAMTAVIARTPAIVTAISAVSAPANVGRQTVRRMLGSQGDRWIGERESLCLARGCRNGDESRDGKEPECFLDVHSHPSFFVGVKLELRK